MDMCLFFQILTIGTSVTYDLVGTDVKDGIVLKHFSATHQTLLIDVKTRKRLTVSPGTNLYKFLNKFTGS